MKEYEGHAYPGQRLILAMFNMARYLYADWSTPLCSELVAKFLAGAGLRNDWWGVSPDDLTKEWQSSKLYNIVFNGILPRPVPLQVECQ